MKKYVVYSCEDFVVVGKEVTIFKGEVVFMTDDADVAEEFLYDGVYNAAIIPALMEGYNFLFRN